MEFKRLATLLAATTLALIAIFIFMVAWQPERTKSKSFIVCTTSIIGDALKEIAGDTIELKVLMGPGVDPHLYKPIKQDIDAIAQADMIFYNGLHLEAAMATLFESMSLQKNTIAVTHSIDRELLIASSEHENFFDPHVWFDPKLWALAVQTITHHLQQAFPHHHDLYEKNKHAYQEKLQQLDERTQKKLAGIKQDKRILITGHDAFSYFAQAYQFRVVSLQGISTASEAGTLDVQNIIQCIVDHKVPTIFVETSIPVRNLQALQQGAAFAGFHVKIGDELFSDCLGSPGTPQATYLGMFASNVNAIAKGLK